MAGTTTTVGSLVAALSTLPSTDIVSWFQHGDKFSQQQLTTLQAELAAYSSSKVGNPKAQALIPAAQFALSTLQSALASGSAQEIMAAVNAAEAAVNAVAAA
ncbi:MAG: hypothetical protein ACLQJ7_17380 [Syntrophobacteraceae bacterium]